MLKAAAFDLGNVVVNFNHRIAAGRLARFTTKAAKDEIYSLIFDSGITQSFEAGRLSPSEFFGQVKSLLSIEIDYERFLPIWNEIFFLTDENLKVHKLLPLLKGRLKLLLISNVNPLHFEYIRQRFGVLSQFDKLILSYEVGVCKPDPIIYRAALDWAEVEPNEMLYIDDRPELVDAAGKLGLLGIHFEGAGKLVETLKEKGVL